MDKFTTQAELARARQRAMGITILLIVFTTLCISGFIAAILNYRSIGPLPASLQHFFAGGITLLSLLTLITGWCTVRWIKLEARCRTLGKNCVHCSYDLSGVDRGICPECGTAIDMQSPRSSTRLKILYGVGAVLAVLTVLALFDVMLRRQIWDIRAVIEPVACLFLFSACTVLYLHEQHRLLPPKKGKEL